MNVVLNVVLNLVPGIESCSVWHLIAGRGFTLSFIGLVLESVVLSEIMLESFSGGRVQTRHQKT